MALPVVLYIPNILGYIRILLAFYALHQSGDEPTRAVILFILSASLDLIDGILARSLNQISSFGVLLDIVADNILRTCGWMAVAILPTTSIKMHMVTATIISLEWMTMLATQLHANSGSSQQHWKLQRDNDPWIVRALFANNFKNPLGILSMYGLFSSYLFAFGAEHSQIHNAVPLFEFFQYTAYLGRALSLVVECWMIKNYASLVIEKDTNSQKAE